jgi:hypothetical protein
MAIDVDEHQMARLLAALRLTVGTALLTAPGLAARAWVGPGGGGPELKVFARATGIREVVLGAGTLRALTRGSEARPWVVGSAASDAVDALAALVSLGRVRPGRALLTAAMAGGAAATGAVVARQLSEA